MRDKKSSETNKIVENVKPSIKLSTISTDSGSFALSALSFADGQLFTVSFDSSFFFLVSVLQYLYRRNEHNKLETNRNEKL